MLLGKSIKALTHSAALIAALALLAPPPASAEAGASICDDECEALLAQAVELRLWESRGWRRLMHAPPRRGRYSEAYGDAFFLNPAGRRDLRAELIESIKELHRTHGETVDPQYPHLELKDEDDARVVACRFPARRRWLKAQLAPDSEELFAEPECPELAAFRENTRADGVSVVFSSYYLNNPASAFGHTFLRIEREDARSEDRRFAMLDYAVDYAAAVDSQNAVIYALRGLFGLFRGEFSIYPYAFKIREYNDLESRDIWEYSLDMTAEERAQLIDHLWELGHAWFRYFYTRRNCSWHILGALEVAMPHIDLLTHVRTPVIPGETLHALLRNEGLVNERRWLPSLWASASTRAEPLSRREVRAARRLAKNPEASLDGFEAERAALILDLAMDLFDIQNLEEVILNPESAEASERQALLSRRASLRVRTPHLEPDPPLNEAPDLAHPARRFTVDAGAQLDGRWWIDLEHRIAAHDGLDRGTGYPDGLAIAFLQTRLRFVKDAPYLHLRDIRFVDISSLSPARKLRTDLSWRLSTGLSRPISACSGCIAGDLLLGGGATIGPDAFLIWLLPAASLQISRSLDTPMRFLRAGVGGATGLRLRISQYINLMAEATPMYHPWQPDPLSIKVEGGLRAHFNRYFSVGLVARNAPEGWEGGLRIAGHFRGIQLR